MVCVLRSFTAIAFCAVTFVLGSSGLAKKTEDCARGFQTLGSARAALEKKIATNLANPPTSAVRVLQPDEIKIVPMADGGSFDFKYTDQYNVIRFVGPKKSIGHEIKFLNSKGLEHKILVVGSSRNPDALKRLTEMVSKLPADALESVDRVELQSFVKHTGTNGYAEARRFVLHEGGDIERTVRHEFGHNLANKIWGRMHPYQEWQKAFERDGGRYVTRYAKDSAANTYFAEDFAESVADYLQDITLFRAKFPNRSALLDTVFRGQGASMADSPFASGGSWQQISDQYGTRLSRVSRWSADNPEATLAATGSTAVVLASGGYGIAHFVEKCREGECPKLPPMRPENQR